MKYKVEDIVKIKENLDTYKAYDGEFFVNSMKKYRGRRTRITCIEEESYKLDIDDGIWNWTDDMLEPIKRRVYEKMKVGDIVKIKENLIAWNTYGDETFVDDMCKYRGRQAKITDIYTHGYDLDIDDGKFTWTDDMLEPISKRYEVIVEGNTVTVKDDKGNEGIAECPFKDKFNLSTAISIAINGLRWKPSLGEECYSVNFLDKDPVMCYHWADDYADNILYERGLVFKTREEAEEVVKTMLDSISRR